MAEHLISLQNMMDAAWEDMDKGNEQPKILHIVKELRKNDSWDYFRDNYAMKTGEDKPSTINALNER